METLTQNYKRRSTSFVFKEDSVLFTYKTRNSDQTIEVPYGAITNRKSKFMEENEWLRNVGLLWLAIGFIFEIIPMLSNGAFHIPMWFTIGLACFLYAYTTKTNFTSIDSGNYNLIVMQDGSHDSIVEKIYEKKKDYLRKNLFSIDTSSTFDQELGKLQFLLDEEVISLEEYNVKKSEADKAFEISNRISQ
jgi:uncharacterized membrane protein YhdT